MPASNAVAQCVGVSPESPPDGAEALELLLARGASPDAPARGGAAPVLLLAQKHALLAGMRADEVLADGRGDTWEAIAAKSPEVVSVEIVPNFIQVGGATAWHSLLAEEEMPIAWYRILHCLIMLLQLPREDGSESSGPTSPMSNMGGWDGALGDLLSKGGVGWRSRTQLRGELLEQFEELTSLGTDAQAYASMIRDSGTADSRTVFEAESNEARTLTSLQEHRRSMWREFITQLSELADRQELATIIPMSPEGKAQREARKNEREQDFAARFAEGYRTMSRQAVASALEPALLAALEPDPAAADAEQGSTRRAGVRDQLPPEQGASSEWHEDGRNARRMMRLDEWEQCAHYILNEDKVLGAAEFRRLRFLAAAEPTLALAVGVCRLVVNPPKIPPAAWAVLQAAASVDGFEGCTTSDVAAASRLLRLCQICIAYAHSQQCMAILLRAGASPAAKNDDGANVLHIACSPARPQLLSQILRHAHGSKHLEEALHAKDNLGRTPAAVAVGTGTHAEQACLRMLLGAGAMNGATGGELIHLAAGCGVVPQLSALLDSAELNYADECLLEKTGELGMTPLMVAVARAHHECVELLLQHQANVQVSDAQRRTPLSHAAAAQDFGCVKMILRAASKEQRKKMLMGGDIDDGSATEIGPLLVAARQPTASALRVMMAEVPLMWRVEDELPLHMKLLHVAISERSTDCVAAIMRECTTLQSRMLQLMQLCVESDREAMLPIICRHAVNTDMVAKDENGETVLHVLANMTDELEPNEIPGSSAGMRRLAMLLDARPDLELLAVDAEGFTALGAAPNPWCSHLLLDAVFRMLPRARVSIVIAKQDLYLFGSHALQIAEELSQIFPGLKPHVTAMYDMKRGEEGAPGSFEIVWEAEDIRCSKLLCSLLSTGMLPTIAQAASALLQHLLGPAASPQAVASLGEVMLLAPRDFDDTSSEVPPKRGRGYAGDGERAVYWPNLPRSRVTPLKPSMPPGQHHWPNGSMLDSRHRLVPKRPPPLPGDMPKHLRSSSTTSSLPSVSHVNKKLSAEWMMHPLQRVQTPQLKFRLDPLKMAAQVVTRPLPGERSPRPDESRPLTASLIVGDWAKEELNRLKDHERRGLMTPASRRGSRRPRHPRSSSEPQLGKPSVSLAHSSTLPDLTTPYRQPMSQASVTPHTRQEETPSKPIPRGQAWTAFVDPTSLQPYFHCAATDKVSWEPPNEMLAKVGEQLVREETLKLQREAGNEATAVSAEADEARKKKEHKWQKVKAAAMLRQQPTKAGLCVIKKEEAIEAKKVEILRRAEAKAALNAAVLTTIAVERAKKKAAERDKAIGRAAAAAQQAEARAAAEAAEKEMKKASSEAKRAAEEAKWRAAEEAKAIEEARRAAADKARRKAREEETLRRAAEEEAAMIAAEEEAARMAEEEAKVKEEEAAWRAAEQAKMREQAQLRERELKIAAAKEVALAKRTALKSSSTPVPVSKADDEYSDDEHEVEIFTEASVRPATSAAKAMVVNLPYTAMSVIADFEAEQDAELSVKVGELVLAMQAPAEGWIKVSSPFVASGDAVKVGFVPHAYLDVAALEELTNRVSALVVTPPHGMMLADFEGESPGEVAVVRDGDSVWRLGPKEASGWAPVCLESGKGGVVPEAYVVWS